MVKLLRRLFARPVNLRARAVRICNRDAEAVEAYVRVHSILSRGRS